MADARPVRAVFFDVGGTLVRPTLPIAEFIVRAARAAQLPVDAEEESMIGARLDALLALRARPGEAFTYPPERSRRRWLGIYGASLEGICSPAAAERIAEEVWSQLSLPTGYELYPDTLPALRALSDAGLVLGVISNWEAWLPTLLDHLGISSLFSCVLASGEAGIEKPDAAIFTAAVRAAGVSPDHTLYVGDSMTDDVLGAMGAGMPAVLLDRAQTGVELAATPVISALTELPPLVASWRPAGDGQPAAAANTSARVAAAGRSTR